MKAIEFVAQEQDGTIIIPEEYRAALSREFRVIILMDQQNNKVQQKRALSSLHIETKDLKI